MTYRLSDMKLIFPVIFCLAIYLNGCKDRDSAPQSQLFNSDTIITHLISKQNWSGTSRLSSGIYSYPIYQNPSSTAPTAAAGLVLYYRYELQFIELSDTSLSPPLLSFSDQSYSAAHLIDAGAVYPVGLDEAILSTLPKVLDTIMYILPPDKGYGEKEIAGFLPESSIVSLLIVIDSIKTESDVFGLETQRISAYTIEANLNDTSIVPGGFVGNLENNLVRYKLLSDSLPSPQPTNGSSLVFEYTLRSLDSTIMDNRYSNTPITMVLGQDILIPGLEAGLRNMHVGEEALILINPSIGYKESVAMLPHYKSFESLYNSFTGFYDYLLQLKIIPEYGVRIPPYQSLVFQVRLVAIN